MNLGAGGRPLSFNSPTLLVVYQLLNMIAIPFVSLAALVGSIFITAVAVSSPAAGYVNEFVRRDAAAPLFIKRAGSCYFLTLPNTSSLSSAISITDNFDGSRNVVLVNVCVV